MSDWSAGYVSEINYTHGFYRELTPTLLAFCALTRRQAAPDQGEGLSYCELGCGQGLSTNLLAAANPGIQFVATDFNPSQIAGARALARDAGTPNVRFLDDSFEQMLVRTDLPDFDIIVLHGIYSWISAANRSHIVEFIRQRLKPGGLVYISYNTLPGWAAVMPLRRLFVDTAADQGGPILDRIEKAIGFAQEVAAANARYFQSNPGTAERLSRIKDQSRSYLAHEYFNRDWTPFYFADVAAELSAAKLSWIASAQPLDAVDAVNLTIEHQKLLAGAGGAVRCEGLRDFLTNQQFRRDIFAKGALGLSLLDVRDSWLSARFVLSVPRAQVGMKIAGASGEVTLQAEIYGPLADRLAAGPVSVKELLADGDLAALGLLRIQQALTVLVGTGHVQPCPDAGGLEARQVSVERFNLAVMSRARASGDIAFLASPVTGGGIAVDRIAQLFVLALKTGHSDPALFAWETFNVLGQRILKDGATPSAEEALLDMRERYGKFSDELAPVYRHLGIL